MSKHEDNTKHVITVMCLIFFSEIALICSQNQSQNIQQPTKAKIAYLNNKHQFSIKHYLPSPIRIKPEQLTSTEQIDILNKYSDAVMPYYKYTYNVYVDKNASKRFLVSLDNAILAWEQESLLKFNYVKNPKNAQFCIYQGTDRFIKNHHMVLAYEEANQYMSKFSNQVTQCKIVASPKQVYTTDTTMTAVLCHEIGHGLGLNHVSNQHDIMYPISGTNQQLSVNDLQKAMNINYCLRYQNRLTLSDNAKYIWHHIAPKIN